MTTSIHLHMTLVLYQQDIEKSRFFRHFHHRADTAANIVIILLFVGAQAVRAILDAIFRVCKAAATFVSQRIQRAEAE